jgi:hypothetical protein
MKESGEIRGMKMKRLKDALAEGEADIASDRFTILCGEDEIVAFFARL